MAGLLRIQPQIPSGSPGGNVPRNAWQSVGQGLSEFGEFLQKQEDAADILAATRAHGEASAGMDGAIKIASTKTSDPTEFSLLAQEGSDKAYNTVRDGLRPGARARYDALMADNLGKAKTAIALGAHGKMVENARGDLDASEFSMMEAAVNTNDPAERNALIERRRAMLDVAQRGGIITPKQAEDGKQAFAKGVLTKRMSLAARQNPEEFITRVEAKEFEGQGIDDKAIQDALDVAGKTIDLRDRRAARETKQKSDAAERAMENLAADKKLDLNELAATARLYGWSKHKVDELTAIQIGTKISSPYEKKIVEDALQPVDTVANPTMAQIREAEARLNKAAANKEISTLSPDYREGMRHLQSLSRSLRIEGDVKDKDSDVRARRTIQDLYGRYLPGPRSDGINSEIRNHNLTLRDMNPAQREAYLDKVEKKLKDNFIANDSPQVREENLRGALKDKR